MRTGAELWISILADRGTVLALVFSTLLLAGMLCAGSGGLNSRARV